RDRWSQRVPRQPRIPVRDRTSRTAARAHPCVSRALARTVLRRYRRSAVARRIAGPRARVARARGGTPMNISFALPWVLPFLLLALVPLLRQPARQRTFAWLGLLPRDRWSDAVGFALRALHALAIALIVIAMARPYRLDEPTHRVGRGAEIVIL